jgi:formylglycine-generating enzyme required for sulfatase activity
MSGRTDAAPAVAAILLLLVLAPPAGARSDDACPQCPETAQVPTGSFQMGKTVDRGYGEIDGPTHAVRLERPFALAVHEVTRGEFRAFVQDTGYVSERKCNVYAEGTRWFIDPRRNWADPGFPQADDHPVVCVSWRDAQAYAAWVNRKTCRHYRLPSEAEYEYVAATGGLADSAAGGEVTHEIANIGKRDCCGGEAGGRDVWLQTAPVGSFPADGYGLRDIRGNVWEWQADCYSADYRGAPADGSARESCQEPGFRVVRGGSYGDAGEYLDARFRLRGPEDQGYFTVGFRLAQPAD